VNFSVRPSFQTLFDRDRFRGRALLPTAHRVVATLDNDRPFEADRFGRPNLDIVKSGTPDRRAFLRRSSVRVGGIPKSKISNPKSEQYEALLGCSADCASILLMHPTATLSVYHSTGPPVEDLAREAWFLDRAADGEISLFLTSWNGPVVVLGYAQSPEEVDLELCRREGIPVLRRLTGGTGVVHRGDLGVGLSLPQEHPWTRGIVGLYSRFLDVLEPALRSIGSDAARLDDPQMASRVRSPICFLDQLSDTLVSEGRKVVGCAQTRRKGAVLIHAAVLLGLDAALYSRVFGVPETEVRAGLAPAVPGGDWRAVGEAITVEVANQLGVEIGSNPLEPVPERYLEPYSTERWAPVGNL